MLDAISLDQTLFGVSLLDWLILIGLWIGIALPLFGLRRLITARVTALAERTPNRIDDLIATLLRGTRSYFVVLVSLFLAELFRPLPESIEWVFQRLFLLGLLLQVGHWGTQFIKWWIEDYAGQKANEDFARVTAFKALGLGARIALWSVLFLMALDNLGVNVTSLVAGLGIGGVAVALAVQNVLKDLLSYISIVVDQPFVYGDFLNVDGNMGTVEHIGIQTTRLRSLSGEQLIFSNSDLLSSRIRNFKRMYERRVVFTIGILYGTPFDKVAKVPTMLREAVESQPDIRFDRAHFKEYGDSALLYETVFFVLKPDYNVYMDIQQAINFRLYEEFETEGIGFAFPTRTLHVDSLPPLKLVQDSRLQEMAQPAEEGGSDSQDTPKPS